MPKLLGTILGILLGLAITWGPAVICVILGATAIPGHVEPESENTLVTISGTFFTLAYYFVISAFVVAPIGGYLGYRRGAAKHMRDRTRTDDKSGQAGYPNQ